MLQNIMRAHCAVIRPDHFKFASYGPDVYVSNQEHIRSDSLRESVQLQVVWAKLLNRTKNGTPSHMLTNDDLYVRNISIRVLFLALAVNSARFQSYMLLL